MRNTSDPAGTGTDTPLTYVEVDLSAIAHNVRAIKRRVGPDVILHAVVKANAYGHGAVEVARTALESGADRLSVARMLEGVQLREAGITAPILVMGYTPAYEVPQALKHNLTLTVNEPDVAQAVSEQAAALGREIAVHVKLDTGMGRFGLLPDEAVPFIRQLVALPGIRLEGLFTHFSVADFADKAYTWEQLHLYKGVLDGLAAAGINVPLRHVGNSGAILDMPELFLDGVRAGVILYGLYPSSEVQHTIDLKPALSIKSHVARVRVLPAGASISYERNFITPHPMSVALVPVGYGDGYRRKMSSRGAVLINGRRARILGNVCMDQFVVDISEVGPVALNDGVVLLGCQGDEAISAEEVARWSETNNYEVVTMLLPRAPRVYTNSIR